jgi:hypothetical protein
MERAGSTPEHPHSDRLADVLKFAPRPEPRDDLGAHEAIEVPRLLPDDLVAALAYRDPEHSPMKNPRWIAAACIEFRDDEPPVTFHRDCLGFVREQLWDRAPVTSTGDYGVIVAFLAERNDDHEINLADRVGHAVAKALHIDQLCDITAVIRPIGRPGIGAAVRLHKD